MRSILRPPTAQQAEPAPATPAGSPPATLYLLHLKLDQHRICRLFVALTGLKLLDDGLI